MLRRWLLTGNLHAGEELGAPWRAPIAGRRVRPEIELATPADPGQRATGWRGPAPSSPSPHRLTGRRPPVACRGPRRRGAASRCRPTISASPSSCVTTPTHRTGDRRRAQHLGGPSSLSRWARRPENPANRHRRRTAMPTDSFEGELRSLQRDTAIPGLGLATSTWAVRSAGPPGRPSPRVAAGAGTPPPPRPTATVLDPARSGAVRATSPSRRPRTRAGGPRDGQRHGAGRGGGAGEATHEPRAGTLAHGT